MSDPKLVAERLMGTTCSECADFWTKDKCREEADWLDPVCSLFRRLPEIERDRAKRRAEQDND
jgi:hypothetical protein